jgi:hypothetical protein
VGGRRLYIEYDDREPCDVTGRYNTVSVYHTCFHATFGPYRPDFAWPPVWPHSTQRSQLLEFVATWPVAQPPSSDSLWRIHLSLEDACLYFALVILAVLASKPSVYGPTMLFSYFSLLERQVFNITKGMLNISWLLLGSVWIHFCFLKTNFRDSF